MEKENSGLRGQRWSLKGMTALVTGGTRGIGHAIVEELAGFGVMVHTCSRKQNELDECLEDWKEKGFKVTGSLCDVSKADQRHKLIETVSSIFNGKLAILVNNAGTAGKLIDALSQTTEDVSTIMSTNFESCFYLCQLAHPLLKASGSGSIVNISSIGSSVVSMPGAIYAASKGAMDQVTKALACEWAKDGIRVNAVVPGLVHTSLIDSLSEKDPENTQKAIQHFVKRLPIQRAGKPEEISSAVAYLCFPCASYITGQSIIADGGYTINALQINN